MESRRRGIATNCRTIVDGHRGQSGVYDLRGAAWCLGGAIDKQTSWWSKKGEANGVVVRCKYALTVYVAQSEYRSSDCDDFTESGIWGYAF